MTRPPRSPRNKGLDGIRGIAALAVLAFHTNLPYQGGGVFGVDLFFVLSGVLITGLLLDEHDRAQRIALGRFWARRAVRLWPPLAATVAASAIAFHAMSPDGSLRSFLRDAGASATWSMDVLTARIPGVARPLGHTWTLAIEEQFYLLWPLALTALLIGARTRRAAPGLLLVLGAASWVVLLTDWHDTTFLPSVYSRPDSRALPLLVGCALALLLRDASPDSAVPRVLRRPIVGGTALVLCIAVLTTLAAARVSLRALIVIGVAVTTITGGALIGHVVSDPESPIARLLSWRVFVALGAISYSVYLVQNPVIAVTRAHHVLDGNTNIQRCALLVVCLGVGAVMWSLVERPTRVLQRHVGAALEARPPSGWSRALGVAPGVAVTAGVVAAFAVGS